MELSPRIKALARFTDFLWRNRIVLALLAVIAACFVAFGLAHLANSRVYSALLIGYIVYYLAYVVHKPKLHASLSFRRFLARYCPSTERSYFPTCFAFGGLAHSFSRALFHRFIHISYRREIVQLSENGTLALDWSVDDRNDPNKLILLLPGLTGAGDSQEDYSKRFVTIANEIGYNAVVMNNRGCGKTKLTSPRSYSAVNIDDLKRVLEHITTNRPGIKIFATGISLGGLLLTHYLVECGERGERPRIIATFVVSVPCDILISQKELELPHRLVTINHYLANNLTSLIRRNLSVFKEVEKDLPIDLDHVLKAKTIRDFDIRFTVPMFGYKTWQNYYKRASTKGKLVHIKSPYLALNADDDPFAPGSALPIDEFRSNANIAMLETRCGGHIGFGIGLQPGSKSLMNRIFSEFSRACFNHESELN